MFSGKYFGWPKWTILDFVVRHNWNREMDRKSNNNTKNKSKFNICLNMHRLNASLCKFLHLPFFMKKVRIFLSLHLFYVLRFSLFIWHRFNLQQNTAKYKRFYFSSALWAVFTYVWTNIKIHLCTSFCFFQKKCVFFKWFKL